MTRVLLALVIGLAPLAAVGAEPVRCIAEAALYQGIDPALLLAIAQHESGLRPQAVNRNRNGTRDIGLMQINSSWLPTLARYGIPEQALMDPCVNAYTGAWILRQAIARYGSNWSAVGAYNAAARDKQIRYIGRIYLIYQRLATQRLQ
ncbi:lytic transglycosylase domain-containing protein [Burkholderia glumae]|uniref:lytic transglycosylase domain-containing protein n=1 Tax=Burkholderia glumae TaxID=337 RepID=UPI00214A41EF|nr:lytic transglycosylase domain-containing protein [Burkholderia glumae]MCR1769770.1 lytic transglycosylase domain-containing protein [Burkholderia glumae]UVT00065.1 lytic transglycosylase [Burkholderia glumae]